MEKIHFFNIQVWKYIFVKIQTCENTNFLRHNDVKSCQNAKMWSTKLWKGEKN